MCVKVSVIIPVYNVSAYIGRCLSSVMGQTYGNIECNDATPDDSITKCEQVIAEYNANLNEKTKGIKFRISHHEYNRGLSAARNTGKDAATGDYVFYLDSDDEITNDCIEKLVKPIKNDTTIEMVKGFSVRKSEDGLIIPSPLWFRQQEKDLASLRMVRDYFFDKKLSVAAWNKLIKKDFLHRYQLYFKEGIIFEDTLWTFFVVKYLSYLYTIPDVTYFYYKRPQSIVTGTSREERIRNWCLVYEEIANHLTSNESGREAKFYVRGFCHRCFLCSGSPSFKRSAHLFKEALSGRQYLLDRMFLSLTVFMSKTAIRRRLFYHSLELGASIRRKVKSIRK